jgi:HD-like signal output (HDOD) protein
MSVSVLILITDKTLEIPEYFTSSKKYECTKVYSLKEAENLLIHKNDYKFIFIFENKNSYQTISLLQDLDKYNHLAIRFLFSRITVEYISVELFHKNLINYLANPPYDEEEIFRLADQYLEIQNTLSDNHLQNLMSGLTSLPTLNILHEKVSSLIAKEAPLYQIAQLIEKDQTISAKVLHLVNSAYYYVKTGSVKTAISYLGADVVSDIVLTASVIDALDVPHAALKQVSSLWEHSYVTNRLFHLIYEKLLNKKFSEHLMSVGLLHNIGSVFMIKYFYDKYMEFLSSKNNENNLLELEHDIFDTDHQVVGGYLLQWWNFNYHIVEGCLYHHTPLWENIINKETVLILHIAQHYAYKILKTEDPHPFYPECIDLLQLDKAQLDTLILETLIEI